MTVTPALSVFLFRNTQLASQESAIAKALSGFYDSVLARTVNASRTALVAGAVILVAGALAWTSLDRTLLPAFKETNLLIKWRALAGTSHPAIARIVSRATSELRALPGVKNVGGHVGRAILSDQISNVNSGEIWVRIDAAADYDATLASIRETVSGYPGFALDTLTYLDEKTRPAKQLNPNEIAVRVYGHDFADLRRTAEDVQKTISNVDGLTNLRIAGLTEEPQVEIRVKLDAAERYGVKPGDVRRSAATLVSGLVVGSLFEEQKVFDVVVWGVPTVRHSVSSIRNLLVDTPGGGHVRLGEIAEVAVKSSPTVIKRESVSRYVDVVGTVIGRGVDPVFDAIEGQLQRVKFPQEYRAEIVTATAELLEERQRLLEIVIATAIAVLLLLQVSVGSWPMAALAFVSLIAAAAGGLLALLLAGGVLTIGSVIGLVGVFALAARNCLSLISRYQNLETHEGESLGAALVQRGTRERFAPIVMTAVTIALAFLPVVFFGSVAGLEILQPMAVAVLGGLVTSTIVNLFVVPALYAWFGTSPESEYEESAQGGVPEAAE